MTPQELKTQIDAAGGRAMPRNNPLWKQLFDLAQASRAGIPKSCGCRFNKAYDWLAKIA
jgi:hypothetical protein